MSEDPETGNPLEKAVPAIEEPTERYSDDRFSTVAAETGETEESVPVPAKSSTWGPKPSMRDQMVRHPESVRKASMKHALFCLKDGDNCPDVAKLDALYARAHGGAPEISITLSSREFYAGAWYVIVHYSELEYVQ